MNDTHVGLAISLATNAVPTAVSINTAGNVLQNIQAFSDDFQAIDYIYVLDDRKLIGVISLHKLFSIAPHTLLQDCMTREVAHVHSQSDQETVAQLALAQNIKAVPVVNRDEEFVGVVTSDTILQILRDEHTEDILKYAGINFDAQDTLSEYTLTQHFTSRIPWLILGLFGGILAAFVVESFSEAITAEVALAAFIPAIVYIADAVGSQTQMVFVRTLTSRVRHTLLKVLQREILVATAVGACLSAIIWLLSFLWLGSVTVSSILALAVFATVYFSVVVAILLPWFFNKMGYDAAVATGPLATVIRDVSSLCIYFLIALSFL